jgi:hypothetical protein
VWILKFKHDLPKMSSLSLNDVLIMVVLSQVPSMDRHIFRVLPRSRAEAMFPVYINAGSGTIPEGRTHDGLYKFYTAATLGFDADFTNELLGVHAELLDYERNYNWRAEGYGDFVTRFQRLARSASTRLLDRFLTVCD